MLEKPDLEDERILARLQAEYGLRSARLSFLALGADVHTAVYRADSEDGRAYFLKLRKGAFDEITLDVPLFLKSQGIRAVIAPLETRSGQAWASLDEYKLILYPFIAGKNGYEIELTERQWVEFGTALKGIHGAPVPAELKWLIPQETWSPQWCAMVKAFQAQVEASAFDDPTAAALAAFMRVRRGEIGALVERAEQLGQALRGRALELVLCHADLHPGNLLIEISETGGGVYIVDWDNPSLAPKEHDLMFMGGCPKWSSPQAVARFYQGYGPAEIDPMALAYYRCERIVEDIAAFCEQLLKSDAGGKDREQSLHYFKGQFLPGCEVELALKTEKL
jgi:spectinomycin phosphotransferase